MGRIKTEAAKGVREYKPTKSIAMDTKRISEEQKRQMDLEYRAYLLERLRVFKAVSIKSIGQGLGEMLVTFNNNLDKPEWFLNEEAAAVFPIWSLRDVVVLLENKKDRKV
jgi:hypothetical protein